MSDVSAAAESRARLSDEARPVARALDAPASVNLGQVAALVALVLASFALLYRNVLGKLVSDWATDDNYSHGFLIIPIALYLAWERRSHLLETERRPSSLGLLVVLGSIVVLAGGTLGAELFLTRISILGIVAGTILFLFGWRHLGIL